MEAVLAFLEEYSQEAGTVGVLIAVILFLWGIIKRPFKKPDTVDLPPATVEKIAPKETGKLHVAEFLRIRREMKADLEVELAAAHEDEKAQLRARIAELESDIANPDEALAEAEKTIADLTARLERMGNEVGGDRLAEARAALERLDFSVADGIFAEVEARQELAVQEAARAAYGRGEVAEAEVRWADAAEHYARAARLVPAWETYERAGKHAWLSGRFDDAVQFCNEMIALSDTEEQRAFSVNSKALLHEERGELSEAQRLFRQALEISEATLGTAHPNHAAGLNNLAGVLHARGDLHEAERLYRQAMEITKVALGEAHPSYANRLNNLALVLKARGDLVEAERLYRQALEIDRAALGEAHPGYATDAINLADLLAKTGRREEAGPLFEAGLRIREAALWEAHPDTVTVREQLEAFRAAGEG